MAGDHDYVLGRSEHEAESARLTLLEQVLDPSTFAKLDAIDLPPEARCLEVGAGRGSVARWLGQRVGPGGRVVAADIDCRFLTGLPDNVEIRTLDIRTKAPEPATYDLVHCRALLMHLPEPVTALEHMLTALRPGGVLLVEEADYGLLSFGAHPDGPWCTELSRRIFDALSAAKLVNSYIGRTLPGLLIDLGLDLLGADLVGSSARPGEPAADWHRMTIHSVAPRLIAAGLLTADELQRMDHVLASPSTVQMPIVGVAAWARRST